MSGNVLYSPALQAPIALVNPTGQLALVGLGGSGQTTASPLVGTMSVLSAGSVLAQQMAILAGALAAASTPATVTQRAVTPRTPIVGAAAMTGQLPILAMTTTQASSNLIYSDSVKGPNWQLDSSFGGAVNFTDQTHSQTGHTYDLLIPASVAWQPVSTNWAGAPGPGFGADVSAYVGVQFDLWTPNPAHQFDMQAHYDGIVVAGGQPVATPTYLDNITEVYGSLTASAWNTKIFVPSVILGQLGNVAAYEFYLRDNNAGLVYLDNVSWVPGPFSWIYSGGQARTWNGSSYTRDPVTPFNGWSDASSNAAVNYAQDPSVLSVGCGPTGLQNPSGTTPPAAPADFFVTLQGQTAQNSSQFNPTYPNPPVSFNVPNEGSIYLGWPDAVAGSFPIGHYEIQHSSDGGATWATPTGGGAISTAAADSQGTKYKDLQCPNSVGSTYGPTSGQYLPATVYLHRLRAVDTQGTPSAWVTGANQYMFNGLTGGQSVGTPSGGSGSAGGGFKWGGDLSSGYPTNYAVVDATYGFVATIDMSAAGGGYFLPTTGCNYCTYNQQIGACDYVYFLLKTSNAAINILMHGEVVGDLKMQPGGAPAGNLSGGELILAKYVTGGTVLANTIQLYKVPLADFMTPQPGFLGSAAAIGVRQLAFYKYLWQAMAPGIVTLAKAWFGK